MSTRKPVSIGDFFEPLGKSGLARLTERSRRLARFDRALRERLPPDLARHCRVGNLRDNVLILYVDSSAWAARLRFHSPQLLRQLRQEGPVKPRDIQVRVMPPAAPRPRTKAAGPRLSSDSARLLEQTAHALGDEKLAQALRRLARHAAGKAR
ncbi:DUF721 domain-containing protein [Thiohalobacter sp. IOR34]|uniref:DUF721 domain-containing protein n=1 Tax=Thiohalobacter sp. IOR34 TaxID=3057176 RepID=UPI0025B26E7F|nr:DUF721 domain-containing protein [Thiohalobacter sp. IOR34]WJW74945.1 DUF721 domain-containing protein [Thiohalobacter sp. IOR34]